MSVDDYKEGVKKRRQERLQLLKKKQKKLGATSFSKAPIFEDNYSSYDSGGYSSSYLFESDEEETVSVFPLLLKVICSVFLVASVYTVMKSDNPSFSEAQSFVNDVMVREYNVKGVMAWYEEKTGSLPVFLPKIFNREQVNEKKPSAPKDYVVPVNGGKVLAAFGQGQEGITVQTASMVPVEVVKEGWVTFVGEKEGLGLTVIIEHGQGEESWYGQLQNPKVQLHDWVSQGQVIGSTTIQADGGQGTLYFALKKDSVFINPLDVMKFD